MDWTLSQIRYAVAVVDTGGFTAAAERLGVRQPTVSNGIVRLEGELGAPLFARTSRKVALTPLGEALLPRLRALLVAEQDLLEELERFRIPELGLIRIGLSPVVDSTRLLASCADWCRAWPSIEMVLKECAVDDMEQRLADQSVDVLIAPGLPKRGGQVRCGLYDEVLCFVPRGGLPRGEAPTAVTLTEIVREPLVLTVGYCGLRAATLRLFEAAGLDPVIYPGNAYSYTVLAEWAELGLGGALLPAGRIADLGRGYPIVLDANGAPATLRLEAIWRRDSLFRPHVASFVDHLRAGVSPTLPRETHGA